MSYLSTFANNLLPVLVLAAAGFLLGKLLKIDPRPLGRVIFYIFSPALVFNLLTRNELEPGKIAGMMGFALTIMACAAGLAFLAGRILHLEPPALIAVVLTSLVANNGNYGLPLIAFAFGDEAQAYASVYFVTSSMVVYTFGVLIASLGHMNLKQALTGLLKVPVIYAILLAVVFNAAGWVLPDMLARPIALTSNGAVPLMLVLLGLELGQTEWTREIKAISIPVIIHLVVAPLIGLLIAGPYGLKGPAAQAGITEAGMPAAVSTTMLAAEYNLDRRLINAIIFTTTVLSPLTLTPLLIFLGK